jgi:hypothetical protein
MADTKFRKNFRIVYETQRQFCCYHETHTTISECEKVIVRECIEHLEVHLLSQKDQVLSEVVSFQKVIDEDCAVGA